MIIKFITSTILFSLIPIVLMIMLIIILNLYRKHRKNINDKDVDSFERKIDTEIFITSTIVTVSFGSTIIILLILILSEIN